MRLTLPLVFLLLVFVCSASAAGPAFDVVSLKYAGQPYPGRHDQGVCNLNGNRVMCEVTLGFLLRRAFQVQHWEMSVSTDGHPLPSNLRLNPGQPFEWVDFEYYQVNAIAPTGTTEASKNLMLQTMLEQRLGLKYHYENRLLPVYELTIAKAGLKLKPALATKDEPGPGQVKRASFSAFQSDSAKLSDLAGGFLTNHLDLPVLDKTGLTGEYRIDLDWSDELRQEGRLDATVIAAVLRKLGLDLQAQKATVKTLVIDHINKEPTPN